MQSTKYLLIGGGMASHRAVRGIRELDQSGDILIVGAEPHLPYERPLLSKKFMQAAAPIQKVFPDGEEFYQSAQAYLLRGATVDHLDVTQKLARLSDGSSVRYVQALIATGGTPRRIHALGQHLAGVHYFRTLDDAQSVSSEAAPGKRAVVVGAGFIGMELGASLTRRGVEVTILYEGPYPWSRFMDEQLGRFFEDDFKARGVRFVPRDRPGEFAGDGRVRRVLTHAGLELPADMVVIAAGIEPAVDLAARAGLRVSDGVYCDQYLRSSHMDVYAAGDVLSFPDPYFNKRRRVEHWGQADYTGALAGRNMAGAGDRYSLLTYVFSDVFDLHLEFAGDESLCQRTLWRGELESLRTPGGRFALLYLASDRLTAYFAVGTPQDELKAMNRLIEGRANLAGLDEQLSDEKFDLSELAARKAI
jgi:NADPH-dependent 2,4-dienoyl-CoA reductase/sulfur reductase-like enzyme